MNVKYMNLASIVCFISGTLLLFQNCGEFGSINGFEEPEIKAIQVEYLDANGEVKAKTIPAEEHKDHYMVEDDLVFAKSAVGEDGKISILHALADSIVPRPESTQSKIFSSIKVGGANSKWPNGEVPFIILEDDVSGDIDNENRGIFTKQELIQLRALITRFNSIMKDKVNGDVKFVEISESEARTKRHVRIFKAHKIGLGGFATLGYNTEKPLMGMVNVNQMVFFHEALHVLGFMHEHQRSDRDRYLAIDWNKVNEGRASDYLDRRGNIQYGDFDLNSIMLYSAIRIKGTNELTIQNNNLSDGDINGLRAAYSTGANVSQSMDNNDEPIADISNLKIFDAHYTWSGYDVKQNTINPSVNSVPVNGKLQVFAHLYNYEVGDEYTVRFLSNGNEFFKRTKEAQQNRVASFFHYNLNLGYFYKNGSISAGKQLKIEVTFAGKTLTRTIDITEPADRFRDIETRNYDPVLKSVIEDMCKGALDEEDCFAFSYDVIDNRINSIRLVGNTYRVSGLYNAWSMSFTKEEHLANNLEKKEQGAERFSVTMNTCETNYFDGNRGNNNLRSHVFWYDLRCIDYVKRGVSDYTAEEVSALNAPVCSSNTADADGDGWGWENGASCVVGSLANNDTEIGGTVSNNEDNSNNSTTESNTTNHPNCTQNASDPDGDGWGWENGASCRALSTTDNQVSGSADTPGTGLNVNADNSANEAVGNTGDNNQATSTENVNNTGQVTFPICSSNAVDNDGDGWGWEHNKTCKVVGGNHSTGANVTIVTNQQNLNAGNEPNCTSASSDSDGDGWGWENGASCKVVGSQPGTVVLPANFESQCTPRTVSLRVGQSKLINCRLTNKGQSNGRITSVNSFDKPWSHSGGTCSVGTILYPYSLSQAPGGNVKRECTFQISVAGDALGNYVGRFGYSYFNGRKQVQSNQSFQASVVAATNTQTASNPNTTSHPDCSSNTTDADGDGWGWENGASCKVVAGSAQTTTTTQNSNTSNGGFAGVNKPVIFAKAFNDYFFVLSDKVCEIKGGRTVESEIKRLAESKGKYQQIDSRQGFTNHVTQARYNRRSDCSSNEINQIKSYLNGATTGSSNSTNSTNSNNNNSSTTNNSGSNNSGSNNGGHPTCASANSDPDGDGWGWENGASCKVN